MDGKRRIVLAHHHSKFSSFNIQTQVLARVAKENGNIIPAKYNSKMFPCYAKHATIFWVNAFAKGRKEAGKDSLRKWHTYYQDVRVEMFPRWNKMPSFKWSKWDFLAATQTGEGKNGDSLHITSPHLFVQNISYI